MKRKKSPVVKIAALIVGDILLLGVVWMGIHHQTQEVNREVNEISELRDPSPFRAALMGHLGKAHLGLEGYLRSSNPSLEKQADEGLTEFETLLPDFVKQNPKLFPQVAAEEISRVFGLFKDTIHRTLEDNALSTESRNKLQQNFTQILSLIDRDLRPIIRKSQADGEERSESMLNIENQARAWHENLVQAWAQPTEAAKAITYENDNRGQTYLDLYARLELLSRERRVQKEIRTLWLANSDLARESFVKESLVVQAEKIMDTEREQVISTLNRLLPAMPPAEMETKKQAIMRQIRLYLATACLIGILGLVSLIVVVLMIYRLLHAKAPLADGIYRAPPMENQDPTIQMDLKGMITSWGLAAETLYGYTSAEMRNQSIGKLFESESEIGRLGRELKAAKETTFETTHKTKTGQSIPVRIEFRPVTDKAGHTTAIGLICIRRH